VADFGASHNPFPTSFDENRRGDFALRQSGLWADTMRHKSKGNF
jgi:hypothetical protein